MIKFGLEFALQFWNDALGQHLAQLDSPLVERVDVPDSPLREHAVFVEGDHFAKGFRGKPFQEDHVGWPVALEDTMRDKPVRSAFCLDLFRFLAEAQRL